MKKKISILLCVVLATLLLSACASDGSAPSSNMMTQFRGEYAFAAPEAEAPMSAPMPSADMQWDYADDSANFPSDGGFGTSDGGFTGQSGVAGGGIVPVTAPVVDGFAEKIIYYVSADIETMEFDKSIENVNALMLRFGAFIENSSIRGVNYASRHFGWGEHRSAYYSMRVPKENLNAMSASLSSLGNIVHENSNAVNITSQFFDTASRLNSLTIQEERLLSMLSQSDEITDLIALEERLGDIRYQIESLTTTLNNWQNQVDYSTVTLNIWEVEEFTEQVPINRSYWEQVSEGFMSTIRSIGKFFMDLFMWLIVSAPVLVILAIIAVATLLIVKYKLRVYRKKRESLYSNTAASTGTQTAYVSDTYTSPEKQIPEQAEKEAQQDTVPPESN
ncbi:MAG: DUF4349 domain-containing protein [Oscillospiraceae bacterium]|jgi:hypothetical protein|nr:DUF4349 domain-containing protein [Oscillospiraceae bacterium]